MPLDFELSKLAFYLSHIVLFGLLVACSYTDWRYRKIYNKITVPAILVGLVLSAMTNFPQGLWNALFACAVGFFLFFILFVFGWMGGGDVKLIAAIGALTGYPFIIDALFFGIIFGGVYAALVLLVRGGLWETIKSVLLFLWNLILWRYAQPMHSNNSIKIPYGLCLSAGTAIAFGLKYFNNPGIYNFFS